MTIIVRPGIKNNGNSRIVSVSCLGKWGRFGNQLFQYAFARAYAEKYQCRLETPRWIGQELFDIHDPPISRTLIRHHNSSLPPTGQTNIDLLGYYQNAQCLRFMTRSWLKQLYMFKDEWVSRFPNPKEPYVAAHLRRGDYVSKFSDVYCVVSEKSYIRACEKFGIDKSKIVWVSEENPTVDEELSRRGLGFLPDFFKLINADVVLRSNSTFAWWAGVLGNGKVFSPVVDDKTGWQDVDFVEGNWPKLVDTKNTKGSKPVCTDLFLEEN